MNLRISLSKVLGGAAAVLLAVGMMTSVAYAADMTLSITSPNAQKI